MCVVSPLSHGAQPWRRPASPVATEARGGLRRSHWAAVLERLGETRAQPERRPQWAPAGPRQRWKAGLT